MRGLLKRKGRRMLSFLRKWGGIAAIGALIFAGAATLLHHHKEVLGAAVLVIAFLVVITLAFYDYFSKVAAEEDRLEKRLSALATELDERKSHILFQEQEDLRTMGRKFATLKGPELQTLLYLYREGRRDIVCPQRNRIALGLVDKGFMRVSNELPPAMAKFSITEITWSILEHSDPKLKTIKFDRFPPWNY